MSKPTIRHQLPDGQVATRSTERPYTHVVVGTLDATMTSLHIRGELQRDERLVRENATFNFQHALHTVKAGVEGPSWFAVHNQDKPLLRDHTVTPYEYGRAKAYLEANPTLVSAIANGAAAAEARAAERIRALVDGQCHIASYSSRYELAAKDAAVRNGRRNGTVYTVEAINNGVRS